MADIFEPPLLVDDTSFGKRSIRDAMDAIEFLEEWPFEKRSKLHACACEACCAAYDGRCEAKAAREAFIAWARWAGIIASGAAMFEGKERAGVVELL
ncbi:hypothetical protein CK228_24480 [Mesorhizobium sp. WSM4312]|uniref:DUF982 domain-containing protein n=1 Tax=unclassified Mesorhizobium TaxID=325217 RepID=UPI000BB0BEE2|nr:MULTISPECIES: DUF982 domain-containing protein [unclassified Mesorhizobium]PBB23963.1 hypothetical protein CK232_24640 [Mesorhizobium sp. WSM4304]PBB65909.1 hypothetical protein CK228_24480 [Mesorhizobium sp. WSM4312]PBB72876.1 hypothetical protein CK227_24725 [Mesorhizobium sp. WSM4308]PBC20097.1 hypothetical protein CK226_25370 [Mesorhizobium sp. WSM4311]TRC75258.1 DUF982 domain-containing protein [Mesorhizobium sp. WSM4310]